MLSGIFFYTEAGDMILGRFYKSDITRVNTEAFRETILIPRKFTEPVALVDGFSFLYIRLDSIYVVGATSVNANVSIIFQFLYDLVDVLRAYFDGKIDEHALGNNFTLVYELLDEVMDHGFPQITAANVLQEYIKTTDKDVSSMIARFKSLRTSRDKPGGSPSKKPNQITHAITGKMDWRPPPSSNYVYQKNEVYLDVLESINLLMSRTGDVLQMSADGQVLMKSLLSGMPECRIGINDKLCLDPKQLTSSKSSNYIKLSDVKLHRCVRLGKFDEDRSILFVPPDGDFELMKYTVSSVILPFHIFPNVIERGGSRVEYEIKVEAKFNANMYSQDIVIDIPCPDNVSKCNVKVNLGKCKYQPTNHVMTWKIKKMYGNQCALLKGEVILTRLIRDKSWGRPPIKMNFEVRMLAASGMKIRYLKVTEQNLGYKCAKWVRYITSAGNYQIRI